MSEKRPTWLEAGLLAALAATLAVLLCRQPAGVARAGGGGGVNGVIAICGDADSKGIANLFLFDTNKQRLCVYRWDGTRLGLVSARAYDYDLEVLDSAGDRNIENGVGATRGYIKAQVEQARRAREMQPPR